MVRRVSRSLAAWRREVTFRFEEEEEEEGVAIAPREERASLSSALRIGHRDGGDFEDEST